MDQQQFLDLAEHVKLRGIFSTVACAVGIVAILIFWARTIQIVKRSDWDSGDRALVLGFAAFFAMAIVALLVFGICCYGPDIFAPKGEIVRDLSNHFPYTIKVNVSQ